MVRWFVFLAGLYFTTLLLWASPSSANDLQCSPRYRHNPGGLNPNPEQLPDPGFPQPGGMDQLCCYTQHFRTERGPDENGCTTVLDVSFYVCSWLTGGTIEIDQKVENKYVVCPGDNPIVYPPAPGDDPGVIRRECSTSPFDGRDPAGNPIKEGGRCMRSHEGIADSVTKTCLVTHECKGADCNGSQSLYWTELEQSVEYFRCQGGKFHAECKSSRNFNKYECSQEAKDCEKCEDTESKFGSQTNSSVAFMMMISEAGASKDIKNSDDEPMCKPAPVMAPKLKKIDDESSDGCGLGPREPGW